MLSGDIMDAVRGHHGCCQGTSWMLLGNIMDAVGDIIDAVGGHLRKTHEQNWEREGWRQNLRDHLFSRSMPTPGGGDSRGFPTSPLCPRPCSEDQIPVCMPALLWKGGASVLDLVTESTLILWLGVHV
ncbi:mCG64540, isoform CRA_a [Mus musculus]|nr:mCG64540, isoform CRA_a [Mus musculus]